MTKRPRKARIRMPKQPRTAKKQSKNKQKMTQEVHVNLSSGGGSASIPTAFSDRTGENVVLQRLSDAVNNFMKQAQDVRKLEPRAVLPVQYNDSPFDDALRKSDAGANPLLNPRPIKNNQSLMAQVNEKREADLMATQDFDAPQRNESAKYAGVARKQDGRKMTEVGILRNQISSIDEAKRIALLKELKQKNIISTITVNKMQLHELSAVYDEIVRNSLLK